MAKAPGLSKASVTCVHTLWNRRICQRWQASKGQRNEGTGAGINRLNTNTISKEKDMTTLKSCREVKMVGIVVVVCTRLVIKGSVESVASIG